MKNIDFDNLTDDQLDRLVNDFKTINMNIPNTYAKAVVSDMKAEIKRKETMQTKEENLEMKLKARDLEITALKDALFIRNQMIQRLDTTIADLNTELNDRENQLEERNVSINAIEDYKDLEAENDKLGSQVDDLQSDLHLTEAQLRSKKIDIELLKDRVDILEKILLPHQELTQWIEEEIDNMDKNELLNFIQKLYDKVHKINH